MEEMIIVQKNVIFLLQQVRFFQNLKKSVMEPTQKREFLDLIINSLDMTLPLTAQKLEKVQRQCLSLLAKKTTSLLELTKLLVFCHPRLKQ